MDSRKLAVITGGEGELGQAITAELQCSNWQVFAPGRDQLDVTGKSSVTTYFSRLEKPINLLVNNAGLTRDTVHNRMTEEEWDLVITTNLKGAFLCSQAALKSFPKKNGGHIVNIGSFSGKQPPIGQANYAAAKAGLVGLGQSLAKEYGKRNIRVNTILPGFLETRMTATLSENALQRIRDKHCLGRFNSIKDAARFITFLDTMTEVSGQVFQLDSRV